jgi:hypothetical protein
VKVATELGCTLVACYLFVFASVHVCLEAIRNAYFYNLQVKKCKNLNILTSQYSQGKLGGNLQASCVAETSEISETSSLFAS